MHATGVEGHRKRFPVFDIGRDSPGNVDIPDGDQILFFVHPPLHLVQGCRPLFIGEYRNCFVCHVEQLRVTVEPVSFVAAPKG